MPTASSIDGEMSQPGSPTVHHERGHIAADGDAGEYDGQHDRERVRVALHVQHEDPEPDHLERDRHKARHREHAEQEATVALGQAIGGRRRSLVRFGDLDTIRVALVPPRTPDGDHTDDHVHGRCDPERRDHTETTDHPEPRHERAGDGASGVARIQHADAFTDPRTAHRSRTRDERQRCAEQSRRHEQYHERQHEADGGQCGDRVGREPGDRDIDALHGSKRSGGHQREGADQDLDHAVPVQRPARPCRPTAGKDAAEGEATEEGRQAPSTRRRSSRRTPARADAATAAGRSARTRRRRRTAGTGWETDWRPGARWPWVRGRSPSSPWPLKLQEVRSAARDPTSRVTGVPGRRHPSGWSGGCSSTRGRYSTS